MVAMNGQCNPKEIHNLMPGGHSDSAPDSAIPVVLEVMPQSGPPETPPPDQVAMEQALGVPATLKVAGLRIWAPRPACNHAPSPADSVSFAFSLSPGVPDHWPLPLSL